MSQKKTLFFLILILFAGFVIRIFKFAELPLYGDELTIGLDAYSLLKTGTDQLGNAWPLVFKMGAGRPAGYVYGSIPFVALFGSTVWGVRGLSVVSGLGIILLMYLLGKKLFSEKVGLISAFLMAISSWDISLSRGGFEVHFALFLSLLGIYALIMSTSRKLYLVLFSFSWGLAIHTYPTYKLTLLLFLPIALWFIKAKSLFDRRNLTILTLSALVISLAAGASLWQTKFGVSEERFGRINIFADGKISNTILQTVNNERNLTKLPKSLVPFFYNRPLAYGKLFITNYLDNYSPVFWFLTGDGNPRHNMGETGAFYMADVLLFFLGVYLLIRQKKNRKLYFLGGWILISPLATALVGSPHFLRSSLMLPAVILINALGLSLLWLLKRRWLLLSFGFILLIQFVYIFQRVYYLAPEKFDSFWSGEAKRVSLEAYIKKEQYDYIFLSGKIDNIEYAYPFYNHLDPRLIILQNQTSQQILGSGYLKKFDNVYIGNLDNLRGQVSGSNRKILEINVD